MTSHIADPSRVLLGWRPPLLGALLGVLLVAGALAGPAYVWVGVVAAQLLLVVSWHRALDAPDPVGGMVVSAILIGAADIAIGIEDDQITYGPIAVVLAAGFLLAVVQQLLRRDGRNDVMLSLSATVSLAVAGALGAGWAVLPRLPQGESLTVIAATAVAAAALGRLLPGVGGALLGPTVLGTAAAALIARGYPDLDSVLGWSIGLAVSVPAVLAALVQVRLPMRLSGWPSRAAWPVLVAAPMVYLVIRFVV